MSASPAGSDVWAPLGESGEAEWKRLAGTLNLSAGFWLGFVFSPAREHANVLAARAREQLTSHQKSFISWAPKRPDVVIDVLSKLLDDPAMASAGCVWIDVVFADPPGPTDGPWARSLFELFRRMNERRDMIREVHQGGLVIAMIPTVKPFVREMAPDLWSVRSLVVELAPVRSLRPPAHATSFSSPPSPVPAPDPVFALAEADRRAQKGDTVSQGLSLMRAAEGLLAEERYAEARSAAEHARHLLRAQNPLDESLVLSVLARIEGAIGAPALALGHIEEAIMIRVEHAFETVPLDWLDLLGALAAQTGHFERSHEAHQQIINAIRAEIESAHDVSKIHLLAVMLERLSGVARSLGDMTAAKLVLEEAVLSLYKYRELADKPAGFDHEIARMLDRLAELEEEMGETARADAARGEAKALRTIPEERDMATQHDFLARVERVLRLRAPAIEITRRDAPPPFYEILEGRRVEGPSYDHSVVGAIKAPISDELLAGFLEAEAPFRREDPFLQSRLIHLGGAAPGALTTRALRRGVRLQSFDEYQDLISFSGYLTRQTTRLNQDLVYPPWLYVEQPAKVSFAGGRDEERVESALASLWKLLDSPYPRFALVLGDFGAGKTFLLHELARRMDVDKHPLVPVLIEMSKLEKQRTIRQLLAQHFAAADVGRIDLDAFEHLLSEGKIALLFDGFDELVRRLSYDRAVEHFATIIEAVRGNAKVVVTSRRHHFLTDHQVKRELARQAERVPGYRLYALEQFREPQIKRFLSNLSQGDTTKAEERYRLIREVRDLMGLSQNPRMLGFIAALEETKLIEVMQREGGISAAKLYELLVDQWLQFEYYRANPKGSPPGISKEALRRGMTELGLSMWRRGVQHINIEDLPESLLSRAVQLPSLPRPVAQHLIGSGSLLVRDADGRFSFMHHSIMEWLVAEAAAEEVSAKGDSTALGEDEMSPLMASFFVDMAGLERAAEWARHKAYQARNEVEKKNAIRVLKFVEPILKDRGIVDEIPVTIDDEGPNLDGGGNQR